MISKALGAALPYFGQITGRRLDLDLFRGGFIGGMIAIALCAGLVAGLYPALFLSSFSPARTIKKTAHRGGRAILLRKSLVVLQFALSTVLIVGTLVVKSQVSFIMSRDLGLAKDNLVTMVMQKKSRDSVDAVRQELLGHPGIAAVSSSSQLPFDLVGWIGYLDWEGRPADRQVYFSFCPAGSSAQLSLRVKKCRRFQPCPSVRRDRGLGTISDRVRSSAFKNET